jgi:sec-independent protein translocase protein TatA
MIGDLFDSPWKILIVAVVLVVLFGSAKLPVAARSLGKSMRILKAEVKDLHEDDAEPAAATPQPITAQPHAAAQQLTAQQLTAQQLTAQELADQELEAQELAVRQAQQQRIDALQQQLADLQAPAAAQPAAHTQQPR